MSARRSNESARLRHRGRADVAIVGGGIVGAACAMTLSQLGLQVVLIEAMQPAAWSPERPDLRVYAFAPDSAALLDRIGAWTAVRNARVQAYRHMRVWDAAGGEELHFDAYALSVPQLGWIVEHQLLQDQLWSALRRSDVALRCSASVTGLEQHEDHAVLTLDDGVCIEARIAIAADGGQSTLRELSGIDTDNHDYAQRGVVAYVATECPHEDTAWQRFLPTGPLAFLPCTAWTETKHVSSIVWTLPTDEAARVLALGDVAFDDELTRAFESKLGRAHALTKRVAFPLRRQLAKAYAAKRVLAIGDAAHVVHPLAGQGVNLGLRDVSALHDLVVDAQAKCADWAAPHRLARWARARRSDAAASAYAFSAINRVFSNDDLLPTLLRGHALGLASKLVPLNRALWRHAAGV